MTSLAKRTVCEAVATALLLAVIVGSGIAAERLSGGNVALALLCNSIATGAALVSLILTFGPISGAHMNPLVSVAFFLRGQLSPSSLAHYVTAQIAGAIVGVVMAHLMFGMPIVEVSEKVRSGPGQWFAEAVATFGLLITIFGCLGRDAAAVAYAVGLYITAAYWFTASTSFANPAVTIARALTATFTGIAPANVPSFIAAQSLGALAAVALASLIWPVRRERSVTPKVPAQSI